MEPEWLPPIQTFELPAWRPDDGQEKEKEEDYAVTQQPIEQQIVALDLESKVRFTLEASETWSDSELRELETRFNTQPGNIINGSIENLLFDCTGLQFVHNVLIFLNAFMYPEKMTYEYAVDKHKVETQMRNFFGVHGASTRFREMFIRRLLRFTPLQKWVRKRHPVVVLGRDHIRDALMFTTCRQMVYDRHNLIINPFHTYEKCEGDERHQPKDDPRPVYINRAKITKFLNFVLAYYPDLDRDLLSERFLVETFTDKQRSSDEHVGAQLNPYSKVFAAFQHTRGRIRDRFPTPFMACRICRSGNHAGAILPTAEYVTADYSGLSNAETMIDDDDGNDNDDGDFFSDNDETNNGNDDEHKIYW
jgi:hypothetical protein